jgi:hypothetical protein
MSDKPKKLIAPEAKVSRWQVEDIFRMKAKEKLAGMDVTTWTPEINMVLEEALAEAEKSVGKSLSVLTKESMFDGVFSEVHYDAKHDAKEELEDCAVKSL